MLIGTDFYYIFVGLCLLFVVPSCVCFWKFILDHEKEENSNLEKRWDDCE